MDNGSGRSKSEPVDGRLSTEGRLPWPLRPWVVLRRRFDQTTRLGKCRKRCVKRVILSPDKGHWGPAQVNDRLGTAVNVMSGFIVSLLGWCFFLLHVAVKGRRRVAVSTSRLSSVLSQSPVSGSVARSCQACHAHAAHACSARAAGRLHRCLPRCCLMSPSAKPRASASASASIRRATPSGAIVPSRRPRPATPRTSPRRLLPQA